MVAVADLHRRHHLAVALGQLQRDDALPAAPLGREFFDGSALAVTVFGQRQHHTFAHDDEGDDLLAVAERDAAYARGVTTHGANVLFVEPYGLAPTGEQHDLVATGGDIDTHQAIAFIQSDRADTGAAHVAKGGQRRLLDRALCRGHEHAHTFDVEVAYGQQGSDVLACFQWQEIIDGAPTRSA